MPTQAKIFLFQTGKSAAEMLGVKVLSGTWKSKRPNYCTMRYMLT
jgi:hypothetical protein